jgi:hypothetical protein
MSILDKASLIQIPSGYKNGKLYSVKPNPTFGSELVTNGDFSDGTNNWNAGTEVTSFTVTSGVATIQGLASNFNNRISQNINVIVGKTYKITTSLKSNDSNFYRLRLLNGVYIDVDSGNSSDFETFTYYHTATNSVLAVYLSSYYTNGTADFSIDNVSVKEVTNIGDFDFSRSSSATRVNSEGLIEVAKVLGTTEEVTNGDFATDSDWSGSASISGGQLTKTSGGLAYQGGVVTANKYYKVVVDVASLDGATQLYFGGNQYALSVGVQTIEAVGGTSNTFVGFNNGYSSSTGSVINSISVIQYIENDVPRLDYGASCASLLLEPQRTNLLNYSTDFSQWTIQSGVTATHNTTETLSPDGTNNATKFVGNGTSGVLKSASVTGVVARSVYLKSVSGTVNVTLKDPIFTVTQKSLSVTTEWQRFDLIEDNTHSSTQGLWIDDIPSSGIYMWGAQLEQGNYLTSYIPTNGSTTTRTADVCNNAGTAATFNSTEGVLFAEIAALADDSNERFLSVSDGTAVNRISLWYYSATNGLAVAVYSGNVAQFFTTTILSNDTDYNKIAIKYKANDFALWVNGVEVATDTSGLAPVGLSELAFDRGDGALDFYGKTKQLMTFNEALSDEELSDLTGQVNLSFNNLANFYNYIIL